MYMVLFVLHDPNRLEEILNAWNDAGVSGITILPSTGMKRLQSFSGLREDLPLIPSLDDLVTHEEKLNRTLFTVVSSDEMVDRVLQVTQNIVGDLDLPNTGILTVIPLARAYGLNRKDIENENPHS